MKLTPARFAILCLALALAARGARGQDAFVFDERLWNAPDANLYWQPLYLGGSIPWHSQILGGNFLVEDGQFRRPGYTPAGSMGATLWTSSFTPFTSNAWVFRATLTGTSSFSNSTNNAFYLSLGGINGAYGIRLLVNRTDGNADFEFGTGPSFNDLYVADDFAHDELPGREIRLTLIDKADTLYALVDDLEVNLTPTDFLRTTAPLAGVLGVNTWTTATLTLGGKFTGSLDNIQLYNASPFIESFDTTATAQPPPLTSQFDNPWNVLDSNLPAQWRWSKGRLEWLGFPATADPWIRTATPETDFISDSWHFDATVRFFNSSNLSANRVIFEFESAAAPVLGVVIPREFDGPSRLIIYSGTESNVIAQSDVGSGLLPSNLSDFPYRVRIEYNAGELAVRVDDRVLAIGAADLGLGTQNWKRLGIRGAAAFGFSIDNVIFHDAGRGQLSVPGPWASYE